MKRFDCESVLVDSKTNEPVIIEKGSILVDPEEWKALQKARDFTLAVCNSTNFESENKQPQDIKEVG